MDRMASLPTPRLTEEQYLHIERLAETKSEFHDGQMFAMSGGSLNHSFIAAGMIALLGRQLPKECRGFNSNLRIRAAGTGLAVVPRFGIPTPAALAALRYLHAPPIVHHGYESSRPLAVPFADLEICHER